MYETLYCLLLLGRTLYFFGEGDDPEEVINTHGREAWEKRKKAFYYSYPTNEARFPARQWYYDCTGSKSPGNIEDKRRRMAEGSPIYGPENLQALSVRAFHLMCFAFIIAMCFKIVDAVQNQALVIICIVLLGTGIVIPLIAGHFNGSLYELN
jgi:hypothetical protein